MNSLDRLAIEVEEELMRRQDDYYIVELEPGVWKAPWKGDPGRTLDQTKAQRFAVKNAARISLGMARRHRPFASAEIYRPIDREVKR